MGIYSMLKNGTEYVDQGQDYYEREYKDRVLKNLKRRVAEMGFKMVPAQNQENVSLDGTTC